LSLDLGDDLNYPRRMLKKSEIKKIFPAIAKFKKELEFDEKRTRIEIIVTEAVSLYLFEGKPFLFRSEDKLIPTLFFKQYISSAPKIIVDMGAVPHLCNGADAMAPGVQKVEDEFSKGDLVLIVEEKYGKVIAIGEALFDSNEIAKMNQGKVIKTLHYVGDNIYEISKRV
jgi:PUA-domain protein